MCVCIAWECSDSHLSVDTCCVFGDDDDDDDDVCISCCASPVLSVLCYTAQHAAAALALEQAQPTTCEPSTSQRNIWLLYKQFSQVFLTERE